jgi:phenylalanyl-tRNA synthetase beta chain
LKALKKNVDHQTRDVRIFELRSVFDETGKETKMLCGLMSGRRYPLHWKLKEEGVDYFDLKGVTTYLFKAMHLKESYREAASRSYFHPRISTQIWVGSQCLGEMGKIQPPHLEAYDLKQDAYLFELNISELQKIDFRKVVFEPPSKFPAVLRDLSILVPLSKDRAVLFDELYETIEKEGGGLVTRIELFDIYKGDSIPSGTESYTFALTYQSSSQTLKDEEVNR